MGEWSALALSIGATDEEAPGLAGALQRLHQKGRSSWPSVSVVPPSDFVAHLAIHVPPDADRVSHLESLNTDDLYLACACVLDLPGAVAAFESHCIARVPAFVLHIDRSPAFADEISQLVRERLLVKTGERRMRLADYTGRGSLQSWVRVTAARVALNHRAQTHEARRVDDDALDQLAEDASAELQVVRQHYGPALLEALRRAVATLDPEQRVILRYYFSAGHTNETIATILGVNRSTASRRLVAARQAVYEKTREFLQERLPLSTDELGSVVRALQSQLNFSLTSLLAEKE
jgi:RNA polymerase sigma-70 factor (ECF subfamily)